MDKNFENALAFYQPAPPGWWSGTQQKVEASGTWLWETLQGDFHEDPSTAQLVTGTVISMIPLVDQLCDVRDFIANCRKIDQDSSNTWSWVALALTLIGAFPIVGSLLKGSLKVVIHSSRRRFQTWSKTRNRDDSVFEPAIIQLKRFLDIPAVRKTLARMNVNNAFEYLADQIDRLKPLLSVELLMNGFRTLLDVTRSLLNTVNRWAPQTLKAPVQVLWAMLERVSVQANAGLEKALGPTRDYLDALSNRLRVEADGAYRARPGNNVHVLGNRESAELTLITKEKPDWVDVVEGGKHAPLNGLSSDAKKKIDEGWPSNAASNFKTFHKFMRAVEIPPGERLYRVVEPGSKSFDNGGFWMSEVEFKKLTSKSEWRRHFAVWKHWNENGEYLIYTVPPGKPLKVWEGAAASQKLKPDADYGLEGGREQILVNTSDIKPEFISPRQKTGWGYDDGTGNPELDPVKPFLGLPDLTHNWHP